MKWVADADRDLRLSRGPRACGERACPPHSPRPHRGGVSSARRPGGTSFRLRLVRGARRVRRGRNNVKRCEWEHGRMAPAAWVSLYICDGARGALLRWRHVRRWRCRLVRTARAAFSFTHRRGVSRSHHLTTLQSRRTLTRGPARSLAMPKHEDVRERTNLVHLLGEDIDELQPSDPMHASLDRKHSQGD